MIPLHKLHNLAFVVELVKIVVKNLGLLSHIYRISVILHCYYFAVIFRWLFHVILLLSWNSYAILNLGNLRFLSKVLLCMESQEIYSDDSSYHSSQDSDYVYDSQDRYSDSSDSYDSSFIDKSELDDDALYFNK